MDRQFYALVRNVGKAIKEIVGDGEDGKNTRSKQPGSCGSIQVSVLRSTKEAVLSSAEVHSRLRLQ